MINLKRGVSTLIAMTIIIVLAVLLVGGVLGYQYYWLPKEEAKTPKNETAEPYIKVHSPNGGEKWEIGKTYEIKWESSGLNSSKLFKIDLERKLPDDNQYWNIGTIASKLSQSGSYQWRIETDFVKYVDGAPYKLLVGEMGESGLEQVVESNSFYIVSAKHETADWKVYEWQASPFVKVRFKYPNDWIVEKSYYLTPAQKAAGEEPSIIGVLIYPEEGKKIVDYISIGGRQASCEPSQNHTKCLNVGKINVWGDFIYTDSNNPEILRVFDLIVSTLEFIETK